MKGTILYAEYDEGTGVSVVTKSTKYGTFTRSVRVHPDDEDIANQYDGCLFAEMKCDIAAYKEKAKFLYQRALGVRHAINVLYQADKQSEYITLDSNIIDLLQRQEENAFKLADNAHETYTILRDSYKALIENNLRTRREIRTRVKRDY